MSHPIERCYCCPIHSNAARERGNCNFPDEFLQRLADWLDSKMKELESEQGSEGYCQDYFHGQMAILLEVGGSFGICWYGQEDGSHEMRIRK